MNEPKAMGILGLTSNKWLDMSSGLTPKEELDNAQSTKMKAIAIKSKK